MHGPKRGVFLFLLILCIQLFLLFVPFHMRSFLSVYCNHSSNVDFIITEKSHIPISALWFDRFLKVAVGKRKQDMKGRAVLTVRLHPDGAVMLGNYTFGDVKTRPRSVESSRRDTPLWKSVPVCPVQFHSRYPPQRYAHCSPLWKGTG